MHKTVTKILIAICLLIGGASAQKIAYIDADAITTNFRKFQEAQKEAQRFEEELTREFRKAQNELEGMKDSYEAQVLLMSERKKKEKQQSIQKKEVELQQFLEEVSGQGGKLQRKTQELLQPIIGQVNEVIAEVAKDKGYDFVLNTAALAFADENHNLTQFVLEALEEATKEELERQTGGTPRTGR